MAALSREQTKSIRKVTYIVNFAANNSKNHDFVFKMKSVLCDPSVSADQCFFSCAMGLAISEGSGNSPKICWVKVKYVNENRGETVFAVFTQ